MGPRTAQQPFLEVAYWIGPTVGVVPTAAEERSLNLNSYRDTARNRQGRDRWVVMHFHFDLNDAGLWHTDGNGNVSQTTSHACIR